MVVYVGNSVSETADGARVALKLGRPAVIPELDGTEFVIQEVVNGRSTGDGVGRSGSIDTALAIVVSSSSFTDDDRVNRPSIPSTVKAAPATTMLPPTTTIAAFVGRTRT